MLNYCFTDFLHRQQENYGFIPGWNFSQHCYFSGQPDTHRIKKQRWIRFSYENMICG